MTTYRISRANPGWTWTRRACVWQGDRGAAYIWRRSRVRIAWSWVLYWGMLAWLVWLCWE